MAINENFRVIPIDDVAVQPKTLVRRPDRMRWGRPTMRWEHPTMQEHQILSPGAVAAVYLWVSQLKRARLPLPAGLADWYPRRHL